MGKIGFVQRKSEFQTGEAVPSRARQPAAVATIYFGDKIRRKQFQLQRRQRRSRLELFRAGLDESRAAHRAMAGHRRERI